MEIKLELNNLLSVEAKIKRVHARLRIRIQFDLTYLTMKTSFKIHF